jgi:branched-chain amino acid transport system permease protein
VFALVMSILTKSLREDEFAVATFSIHSALWIVLLNWTGLTRGPLGIANVPPLSLFGHSIDGPAGYAVGGVVLVGLAQAFVWRLRRRPIGFLMRLVRDDELLAEAFGRDVGLLRHVVWVTAATAAAVAGLFQAAYFGYVSPISFTALESTMLLAVVLLGGLGTFWGPVIGAIVMTAVPELLRFVGLPTSQAANIRQVLFGVVLVVVVFRIAERQPSTLATARGDR